MTVDILLVEDDPGLRGLLALELELAGYQVKSYASAEQALAGGLFPFDLVILDYDLPGMNGLALLECLHQSQANLPALLMSSACPNSGKSAESRIPCPEFLSKPFEREQFMQQVARLLDGANSRLSLFDD